MTDIPTTPTFTGSAPSTLSTADLLETIRVLREGDERAFRLNAHQHLREFHPYTCGNNSKHRPLIATSQCWRCADCDYSQPFAAGREIAVDADREVEAMFGLLKDGKIIPVSVEAVSP